MSKKAKINIAFFLFLLVIDHLLPNIADNRIAKNDYDFAEFYHEIKDTQEFRNYEKSFCRFTKVYLLYAYQVCFDKKYRGIGDARSYIYIYSKPKPFIFSIFRASHEENYYFKEVSIFGERIKSVDLRGKVIELKSVYE